MAPRQPEPAEKNFLFSEKFDLDSGVMEIHRLA
jgi:hypothetical protein